MEFIAIRHLSSIINEMLAKKLLKISGSVLLIKMALVVGRFTSLTSRQSDLGEVAESEAYLVLVELQISKLILVANSLACVVLPALRSLYL